MIIQLVSAIEEATEETLAAMVTGYDTSANQH